MNWDRVREITTVHKEASKPSKSRRKRDLWTRLQNILAERLETRYGYSSVEAQKRAEEWLCKPLASEGTPLSKRELCKIIPIR